MVEQEADIALRGSGLGQGAAGAAVLGGEVPSHLPPLPGQLEPERLGDVYKETWEVEGLKPFLTIRNRGIETTTSSLSGRSR